MDEMVLRIPARFKYLGEAMQQVVEFLLGDSTITHRKLPERGQQSAHFARREHLAGGLPLSSPSLSCPWRSPARRSACIGAGGRGLGSEIATVRLAEVAEDEASSAALPPAPPTCGGLPLPSDWPDFSSPSTEALLASLFSCTSTEFVALQQRVDMPRLVQRLDSWGAVRLGALGPVREDGRRGPQPQARRLRRHHLPRVRPP